MQYDIVVFWCGKALERTWVTRDNLWKLVAGFGYLSIVMGTSGHLSTFHTLGFTLVFHTWIVSVLGRFYTFSTRPTIIATNKEIYL